MKALEKKNTDQETKHVRMITMLDKVVDSQDNQLRHQKFEMGEQERKFEQEMKDMKVKKLHLCDGSNLQSACRNPILEILQKSYIRNPI